MTDQELLDAAQAARHKLILGQAAVEVQIMGSNGSNQRVRFTAANREALESYIGELQDKIRGCRDNGAIGFVF